MFGVIIFVFIPGTMVAVTYFTFGQVSNFFVLPLNGLREIMADDQCCGSESTFILVGSIRIRIGNPDPDLGGQNLASKLFKTSNFFTLGFNVFS